MCHLCHVQNYIHKIQKLEHVHLGWEGIILSTGVDAPNFPHTEYSIDPLINEIIGIILYAHTHTHTINHKAYLVLVFTWNSSFACQLGEVQGKKPEWRQYVLYSATASQHFLFVIDARAFLIHKGHLLTLQGKPRTSLLCANELSHIHLQPPYCNSSGYRIIPIFSEYLAFLSRMPQDRGAQILSWSKEKKKYIQVHLENSIHGSVSPVE